MAWFVQNSKKTRKRPKGELLFEIFSFNRKIYNVKFEGCKSKDIPRDFSQRIVKISPNRIYKSVFIFSKGLAIIALSPLITIGLSIRVGCALSA